MQELNSEIYQLQWSCNFWRILKLLTGKQLGIQNGSVTKERNYWPGWFLRCEESVNLSLKVAVTKYANCMLL